uniref:Uncharacterized protein n=1 Tax=Arundo donax TaxID=35708 RepID=A0A0A9HH87_ARUDO
MMTTKFMLAEFLLKHSKVCEIASSPMLLCHFMSTAWFILQLQTKPYNSPFSPFDVTQTLP